MNRNHCIWEIRTILESIHQPKDDSLDKLLEHVQIERYNKSEEFQRIHTPATKIGVLLQGAMMVKRHEDNGDEKVVFFNTPDKTPFVGVLESLIKNEESTVQIKALADSWIGVVEYQKLLDLYSERHELETLGRKILEKHYLMALEQARFRQSTAAKVKWSIIERDYPQIFELCEKKDIANFIGVQPSTLSRLKKKYFKKTIQN